MEINPPVTPDEPKRRPYVWLFVVLAAFFVVAGLVAAILYGLNQPGRNTEYPISFTVVPGEDARTISRDLEDLELVRSAAFLNTILVAFFDPTQIKASTYVVEEPMTALEIATKLIEGDFGNDLVRFTHIEGESVEKLADRAAELPNVSKEAFIAKAQPFEGRLFPDTYFIRKDFTETELIALLRSSFDEALAPLQDDIAASTFTLDQILILASIIEREANTPESMRLVSSVFQNRIAIGMPLQADASIEYILDKPLQELTPEDLTVDSPYNTYTNPGLPPTPIGNPGLQAIEAVLRPTPSPYLFYLTAPDGTFYYAETYDEHLRNIDRYLR